MARRVVAREAGAFEAFFEVYFDRLYRFCRTRIANEAAIEDVVQEVLIKALRKLHLYRGEASLFSWLCQICRHELSDWYARNNTGNPQLVGLDDDPHIEAALSSLAAEAAQTEAAQQDVAELVGLALDYLPDRYGQALEWKYLEGLNVNEIAHRLNLGQLATQSLLARARAAFRRAFAELDQELKAQQP